MFDNISVWGIIIVVAILVLVFGRDRIMQLIDRAKKRSGAPSKSKTSTAGSHPKEDENSMV